MKQGKSLEELTLEILRQREAKEDYMADTRRLTMDVIDDGTMMELDGIGSFGIREHAHRQIGERLEIPARYYDRMLNKAPGLLAENVNHWFRNKPETRTIRTLDGNVRAFLSDRYRPMDHHDLAEAVLPVLAETGAQVMSAEINDERMYLKAVITSVQETVMPPPGSQKTPVVVSPGIVISNSEVGTGALAVQPAVHTLACTNMAVWAQHALRKHHVGRVSADNHNDIWQFMSDRTREITDAALWSQVRDLTRGALQGEIFDKILHDLKAARAENLEDPVEAIEHIGEKKGLPEGEKQGILKYLVEGGDLSKFGLSNAITRFSQDLESYERATYLEQVGGDIIAISQPDWDKIAA